MKKKLFALFAALVAVCSLCAFAACGRPVLISNGEQVVFTVNAEILELTEEKVDKDEYVTLYDYLGVLQEKGELEFEGYDGDWGFYLTSVNGTKSDDAHFWLIYTDLVTTEDGTIYSDASFGTYEYNGKTLNSASYGVSALPCFEGYTYALVYSSYSE